MVKVVPTEEGAEISVSQQGKETHPTNDDNTAEQHPPTKDDPAEGQQPTISTTAGASVEEEDQRLSSDVPDAVKTGSDVELSPPRSTDPFRKPSENEEMHHEVPQQLEPGTLALEGGGSDVIGKNTNDAAPTLDMDKHSGMTTFALMRHDDESSLDQPDAGLSSHSDQDKGDEENTPEALVEEVEENDEEDSELAPRPVRQNTGATRKFVRQNTGIDGGAVTGGKKKKTPFRVPQTMYMGHPVGSPAAEFLERQQRRLAQIKTRREEVAGLLELVIEHQPKTTGSSLPDIDAVFPDKRGREQSQGDWCV